jgi:hypothetical protein
VKRKLCWGIFWDRRKKNNGEKMKNIIKLLTLSLPLAALLCAGSAMAFQDKSTKPAKTAAASTTAPSDKDIADAKTKGMVWVNTSTKVYHKDGEFYGKTKQGKFMTESDAQKAGCRAAKEPGGSKKSTTAKKSS